MITIPAALDAGLFDRAEVTLLRMLAADPTNARALARLGDFRRGRGDLAGALAAYRRLRAIAPDDATAAWSIAVLGGTRLPDAAPPGGRAAPFVRMTNFLSSAACDRLLAGVSAASDRFVPAQVRRNGNGMVNRKIRIASCSDARINRDVRSWFVPRLRGVLPEVLGRLRMEDLDVGRIELEVTVHRRGAFFATHRDGDTGNLRSRKLSYVYHFHRAPRPFVGGDLLLYDDAGGTGGSVAFSRIDPLRDSVLFFPADCMHEVTPVAFGDGRFTVNGWIHSRHAAEGRRKPVTPQGQTSNAGAGEIKIDREPSALPRVEKPARVRHLGAVDVETLRSNVERLSERVWREEDAAKENDYFCFAHTRHIVFRFINDNQTPLSFYSTPIWAAWQRLLLPVMAQAVVPYGYTKPVYPKAMLARLEAGHGIDRHVDGEGSHPLTHRIHVPLQTNPRATLTIQDTDFQLQAGHAYEVNNLVRHGAFNGGDQDRVHFIFEVFEGEGATLA